MGSEVLYFVVQILDALVVFGVFGALIWCTVSGVNPLIADTILLFSFLRLLRLPSLCCGKQSLL